MKQSQDGLGKSWQKNKVAPEYECPLCRAGLATPYFSDRKREFFRCKSCGLVSVPEKYHLSESDEKIRYDLHENHPDNKGYFNFLNNFVSVIRKYIVESSNGLDFGSGPTPVLAEILSSIGYDITIFDPFYADDRFVLDNKYDFITLVEVVEHLKDPEEELRTLWECLNQGGMIGIMTGFLPEDKDEFRGWSYKNDSTHICFYSVDTFKWISKSLNSELMFPADNIVLMFKT